MKRSTKIVLGALLATGALGLLAKHGGLGAKSLESSNSSREERRALQVESQRAAQVASTLKVESKQERSDDRKEWGRSKTSVGHGQGPMPLVEVSSRLKEFARIKAKVFLTDEDKEARRQMLEDRQFLRSLKTLLDEPPVDRADEAIADQFAALDLLFAALPGEGCLEAEGVLREIVSDARLEDESLAPVTRKGLAEIKADVLYLWTAQEPGVSADLEKLLPGPVSRKIWDNVIEAQGQNIAESQAEMK